MEIKKEMKCYLNFERYAEIIGGPNIQAVFEYLLFKCIDSYDNGGDGKFKMSSRKISIERNIHRNTVDKALDALQKMKLVYIEKNMYFVDIDKYASLLRLFETIDDESQKAFHQYLEDGDYESLKEMGYCLIEGVGKSVLIGFGTNSCKNNENVADMYNITNMCNNDSTFGNVVQTCTETVSIMINTYGDKIIDWYKNVQLVDGVNTCGTDLYKLDNFFDRAKNNELSQKCTTDIFISLHFVQLCTLNCISLYNEVISNCTYLYNEDDNSTNLCNSRVLYSIINNNIIKKNTPMERSVIGKKENNFKEANKNKENFENKESLTFKEVKFNKGLRKGLEEGYEENLGEGLKKSSKEGINPLGDCVYSQLEEDFDINQGSKDKGQFRDDLREDEDIVEEGVEDDEEDGIKQIGTSKEQVRTGKELPANEINYSALWENIAKDFYKKEEANHKTHAYPYYPADELRAILDDIKNCLDSPVKLFINQFWAIVGEIYGVIEEEDENGNLVERKVEFDNRIALSQEEIDSFIRNAMDEVDDAVTKGYIETEEGKFPVTIKEGLDPDLLGYILTFESRKNCGDFQYMISSHKIRNVEAKPVMLASERNLAYKKTGKARDNMTYLQKVIYLGYDKSRCKELTPIEEEMLQFMETFFFVDPDLCAWYINYEANGVVAQICNPSPNCQKIQRAGINRFLAETTCCERDEFRNLFAIKPDDIGNYDFLFVAVFSANKVRELNEMYGYKSVIDELDVTLPDPVISQVELYNRYYPETK